MLASTPVKLRQHFICIAMCTESDVGLLALCVSLAQLVKRRLGTGRLLEAVLALR